MSILFQEIWTLVKLNLLFLATCLPVVTVGPAMASLGHVMAELVRGHSVGQPVRTYLRTFRDCFRRSVLWGLLALLAAAILTVALLFYWTLTSGDWFFLLPMSLTLLGMLVLWGILLQMFPLLAEEEEEKPGMALLRQASLRALERLGRTLLALAVMGGMLIAQVLFFPASVPVTLLLGCVLPALAGAFVFVDRSREEESGT